MDKQTMIRIADRAVMKNMDYETLKYSDDMYGREDQTDDVWKLVEECREIGTKAFDEKYGLSGKP